MQLILIAVGILLVPSLLAALVLRLVLLGMRRRPALYWRRTLYLHLLLIPIYAFLVIPGALGFLAPRFVDTREDEQAYAGPRIVAGDWVMQSRGSLETEEMGLVVVAGEVLARSRELAISFSSADGTSLQAYLVPPLDAEPVATVVMVHGLFRNALELERAGDMFRRNGAEVCLLELRNHGGSGSTLFSFGLHESEDVESAVQHLQARPGREKDPVVLFGVSLGTAAVALAAPRIENLAGVVLDAPMDDLLSTAHRMLSVSRGRVVGIPNPFRSLMIRSVELWSGYRMSEVRPLDVLASLPADLPVLLIGAGLDARMPPDTVTNIYESLQSPEGVKELWILEGAEHGRVWEKDPRGYEERIVRLLDRLRRG